MILEEVGGRNWRLDPSTGALTDLAARLVVTRTLPNGKVSEWPGYGDAPSVALVEERERGDITDVSVVRLFDSKGRVLVRSTQGMDAATPLRVDRRGRAHWAEVQTDYVLGGEWIRYDAATRRTERRRLGPRLFPIAVAPDGERLLGGTTIAPEGTGPLAFVTFAGRRTDLPPLDPPAAEAALLDDGVVIAAQGDSFRVDEKYEYRFSRLDPKSRTWTPLPLKP